MIIVGWGKGRKRVIDEWEKGYWGSERGVNAKGRVIG